MAGEWQAALRLAAVAASAVLLAPAGARAERLPVRVYGPNEGLAGDHVRAILQDARGFLWFATNAGVSKFDGDEFVNYGVADGLPTPSAYKIVEGGDGRIYVLTHEGCVRSRSAFAAAGPVFEPLALEGFDASVGAVQDMVRAPDGAIVLAGERGAFRFVEDDGRARVERIDLGPAPGPAADAVRETVWAVAFDPHGALWAVRDQGVSRRAATGDVRNWRIPPEHAIGPSWGWFPSMTTDRSGRVWLLTTGDGAWRLDPGAPPGGQVVAEVLDADGGFPSRFPRALEESADGTLWIGTADAGLVRCPPAGPRFRCAALGTKQGFPDDEVFALATDRQGDLWAGTQIAGALRVAAEGATSWGEADGLHPSAVSSVQDHPDGGLLITLGAVHLASLRDGRIASWRVRPSAAGAELGWGSQQVFARDREGRTWLATGAGAYVYRPGVRPEDLAWRAPDRVVTTRDGLSGDDIFRVFVDRAGNVWLGVANTKPGLCRLQGEGGKAECFGEAQGAPSSCASAFAEDASGNLWIGTWEGGVYRYRHGRFETWPEVGPAHQSGVISIRRDGSGRLWVSGTPGVLRIEAPESEQPSFRRYDTKDGLSSVTTCSTADDAQGRLYVGGVHGVDRLDHSTGAVRTFTVADGLPSNRIATLHRDPAGILWIGTSRGIARLVPRDDTARAAPPVFITAVRIAGTPRDPAAGPMRLGRGETNVEFAFTSPSFRAGETMRFQARLVGAGDTWGPPGTSRLVSFAGLLPGSYRFEVRAINGDGLLSTEPAAVEFTIPPPVWRRPWFSALLALMLGAAAVAFYKTRVARLVALERVRMHIATDLHDDIGSNLSHIAILGQLARRQAERGDAALVESLDRITESSGELVDAMSDVVWSINPVHDRLADLAHRMRRFASELFADSAVALELDLPEADPDERIDPDARRQIYLIFKEALHNALRHSGARRVSVALRREGPRFLLRIRDDGRGISGPSERGGHGLESMRTRARAIGARLEIDSSPGGGTEIALRTRGPDVKRGNHPRG